VINLANFVVGLRKMLHGGKVKKKKKKKLKKKN
jgi:hypothetical protein